MGAPLQGSLFELHQLTESEESALQFLRDHQCVRRAAPSKMISWKSKFSKCPSQKKSFTFFFFIYHILFAEMLLQKYKTKRKCFFYVWIPTDDLCLINSTHNAPKLIPLSFLCRLPNCSMWTHDDLDRGWPLALPNSHGEEGVAAIWLIFRELETTSEEDCWSPILLGKRFSK